MNNPTPSATSPGEQLVLVAVGVTALLVVLGSAGALWLSGTQWLVEQRVLVPAAANPLIAMPGAAGAGLDGSRVAVAAGALTMGLACLVSAARRALTAREGLR
jgi:hypothetical protein